mmetsp:Transcript_5226/g.9217  ORF Transcript_5226/g.9217 Transcript_5226/m.9217 type:complete len:230 (+) Transcript_5226:671-1360(+)
MEAQAHRAQAERARGFHQLQRAVAGGAELAGQGPIGAGGFDQKANVDLRARGVLGDLFQLLGRVHGKDINAHGMGEGNVSGFLDRVAKGDMRRRGTGIEAHLDLDARGGVEPGPHRGEARQDFRRRVGFHRVVDVGLTKACRQRIVLLCHAIHVEDQRRALEAMRAGIGLGAGYRYGSGAREGGKSSGHHVLQVDGTPHSRGRVAFKGRRYRRYVTAMAIPERSPTYHP